MNQLKTKIEEVKAKLGVSTMQLSERIGKNPYYLYKVVNGVSTERQKELMLELDLVANGGTVMTERAVIAGLTEKAEALQSRLNRAQAANKELCQKLEFAEKEYNELDMDYGRACNQMIEIGKRIAPLQEYKRQYRDLFAAVIVAVIIVILGFALWSVL